ncbi:hypothetical protein [Dyadobacter luteus]|nr:hypothetical protein [Dyadobacter luteus]
MNNDDLAAGITELIRRGHQKGYDRSELMLRVQRALRIFKIPGIDSD